ncbi:MAG: rRNA maturation RNase YbeY [Candidatus Paceibacterota bacterium]|jgi:probable rRNA maturation factor
MTEIKNLATPKIPDIPFDEIKNSALGKEYSLSVVFVPHGESNRINKEYRKKNKPTNILSFPYTFESGEIVLCAEMIKDEAEEHKLSYKDYLTYLYIHGLVHLAGFDHSLLMERREIELRKKYLPADFVRP